MSDPRAALCIFCDDIRQEVGNKTSFMGIYSSGDMHIAAGPPGILATLGVSIWLISDLDDIPTDVNLRILMTPGDVILFNQKIDNPESILTKKEGAFKASFNASVKLSPVIIPEAGFVEAWVDTEKGSLRAGRLQIHFSLPNTTTTPIVTESTP